MLHEQWKERTFAAGAATYHHRTDGMPDKPAIHRAKANDRFMV